MKITLFGSGYVGLVTGACFAEMGNDVLCVDIDADKIAMLREGNSPIHEPGLDALLQSGINSGCLQFTTDAAAAVAHGEYLFIAVGTPQDQDGSADLQYVEAVARSIAESMTEYRIIIDKSTVPVGTADTVRRTIQSVLDERQVSIPFDVVSNPEFLKEGAAINDFMKPDRILVGSESVDAIEAMRRLYAPFNRNHDKFISMDTRSAELTKYAANAMLATKISFMNELSNLAERFGADIEAVRRGIGSDPRIGTQFIYPGCGYGGSCFPKDVRALIRSANEFDYEPSLIQAVDAVNDRQKSVMLNKILGHYAGDVQGKTFALWGLAFKPNTDDMREAPSRVIIDALVAKGAKIQAYDPAAMDEAARIYQEESSVVLADSARAACEGADALIIVTEWSQFRSPNFAELTTMMTAPTIFDGRNLYDPAHLAEIGFNYYSIGRTNG